MVASKRGMTPFRFPANFIEKASRLYEQERWALSGASLLEMYARRWFTWVTCGLRNVEGLHVSQRQADEIQPPLANQLVRCSGITRNFCAQRHPLIPCLEFQSQ